MYREPHLDLSRLDRISVHPDSVSQYWLEDGDILVVRSSLNVMELDKIASLEIWLSRCSTIVT